MKQYVFWLPLFVLLLSASQCNSTKAYSKEAETLANNSTISSPNETASTAAPSPPTAPTSPQEGIEALLQPNEEGIPYPIYDTFDQVTALLTQQDDRVYVINFWATWCQPCVAELPYFEQLAAQTAGQDVQIVMVSLDFQRDLRGKLKRFVENRPFTLPLLALADQDYNSWIGRVEEDWQGGIPATVIYKKGKRSFHERAFPSYTDLLAAVNSVR